MFYNEQEYYYALKKMDNAEWIILFIVPSLYVAQEVISLVETTATLILVFTVSLSLISILIYIFLYCIGLKNEHLQLKEILMINLPSLMMNLIKRILLYQKLLD